jgi:hypothetical protein
VYEQQKEGSMEVLNVLGEDAVSAKGRATRVNAAAYGYTEDPVASAAPPLDLPPRPQDRPKR